MNKLTEIKEVTFVCTGNTCRSPMAEAYFRSIVESQSDRNIVVNSAGLSVYDGGRASEYAATTVLNQNLTLSGFRSQALTDQIVDRTSIIVTMTRVHAEHIVQLYPNAQDKTRTLLSFLGSDDDVADPYGGPRDVFLECFETMKPALDALLQAILSKKPE